MKEIIDLLKLLVYLNPDDGGYNMKLHSAYWQGVVPLFYLRRLLQVPHKGFIT